MDWQNRDDRNFMDDGKDWVMLNWRTVGAVVTVFFLIGLAVIKTT